MGGGKPIRPVWVIAILFCGAVFCQADGNVGCLFSQTVCLANEWCYDDFAFGKCWPMYSDVPEEDKFRYSLTKYDLEKFEEELQRLVEMGYHWEHTYTQCILQAMLNAARYSLVVDIGICDPMADRNILSVTSENPNSAKPPEMAYIKFAPNSNTDETDFADEFYWPNERGNEINRAWSEGKKELNENSQNLFNRESAQESKNQLLKLLRGPNFGAMESNEIIKPNGETYDNLQMLKNIIDKDNIIDQNVQHGKHPDAFEAVQNYRNKLRLEDGAMRKVKKGGFFHENNNGVSVVEFPEEEYEDITPEEAYNSYNPSTVEYLTENRMDPSEMNLFYKFFNSAKGNLDVPINPNAALPESRIYVDEDEPEIFKVDSGSGEFNPNHLFDNVETNDVGGAEETISSDALKNLMRNWINKKTETAKIDDAEASDEKLKDITVLYAEGGVVYPLNKGGKSDAEIEQLVNYYDWGFKRPERLDVKKPGPPFDVKTTAKEENKTSKSAELSSPPTKKEVNSEHENHNHNDFDVDTSYTYVGFRDGFYTWKDGANVVRTIGELLHLEPSAFTYPRVDRNEVTFRVEPNSKGLKAIDVANNIDGIKEDLKNRLGVEVVSAGVGDRAKDTPVLKTPTNTWKWADWVEWGWGGWGVLAATAFLVLVSCALLILLIRRSTLQRSKLQGLTTDTDTEATQHYQDLCRARMSGKQQQPGTGILGTAMDAGAGTVSSQRVTSLSRDSDGNSPSNRSSTSSWSEEPALTNMDISTGHMVLAYMEDHLKNKDRLEQEWHALCAYEAEPCTTIAATSNENVKKNRYPDVLPYDHARVTLNQITNHLGSDYINASTITDHDPRNPAYIATQGPLPHTTPEFWQMIWEQGSVVMVMLTRLTENGTVMCHRYWSEEGSALYHIYEVHLVSEHIWCDDYLVRSFYLKNVKTGETRTVTQFHFLSWPENGVPSSTKALLEFRRKVNKSYRGRSCPITVHCSDGASRTGTYCLIDMVLNRMAKGAKEIDIAATLEHIRDQRPNMVTTKQQFEFVLMAVAEEVHAILKALPSQLQQQKEASKETSPKEKETA